MTFEDVAFGDVFSFRGIDYVYFAESTEDGIIYAGKILDRDDTKTLDNIRKSHDRRNTPASASDMFSYVILTTTSFKNQAVMCATYDETVDLSSPYQSLSQDDINSIKTEIMSRPGLGKLKQIIEHLS